MSNWPVPGDSLLALESNWRTVAILGGDPDWIISYALSFKNAADIVVLSVDKADTSPDSVSYSVIFLYKHYLELMLKGLIRAGKGLTRSQGDFSRTHDLRALWGEFRPLIEDVYPAGSKAETDAVEKCVLEMNEVGESGRYGEHKGGLPILKDQRPISLSNLRSVMNRIAGFLEGSYDWMHEMLQNQADMDSEAF